MESSKKVSKKSNAWPTKEAMSQVYSLGLWGSNEERFYSGEGSHSKELVEPYVLAVTSFLKSFKEPQVVCDLGCGDFNIGQQLVAYTKKYWAVDIVPELIAYNIKKFQQNNLEFTCLDIATDKLPKANIIILRQVLQHLSNAEVLKVIEKLKPYHYVILTEHLPNGDFVPNKDIISGQGIRLKKQSGLNLLQPPFNLKVLESKELLRINLGSNKGEIVTMLYQLN